MQNNVLLLTLVLENNPHFPSVMNVYLKGI